ncbi:BREX-4 system phosphatase PglZ [Mitsuokella sp. oral taxon 131]|mgnify:CR=1 FL=1|uniref:BREX-4 system phosphatase PglZ n=1 Tax=Mitsuokella sp. oral taxon 131 TaxID=1321780 RepID=UPI0003ADE757|nr:BREX-4 system phosphatase PglZ [Mitsuokella sp. oral taxon 131]ERL25322.1 hypothetical protein HMPREF1985_00384 [Mitsuokella sp. oral taxon 131 str. W9106]
MTVEQVINTLQLEQEQNQQHRFCCRAIMVKNIAQYSDLLARLRKLPHAEVVPSSYLFDGDDILPSYENLISPIHYGKWLILPGVSEYLRFFGDDEVQSRRFDKLWNNNWPSTQRGRIIIPLWGCSGEWHDKSLHFMDKIERTDEVFFDCVNDSDEEQKLNIDILSVAFRNYKPQLIGFGKVVIDGLRSWYDYWTNPPANMSEYVLITGRIDFIRRINGNISVRTVKDMLSFMQTNMHGGNTLTEEYCPKEAQECLFEKAPHGSSVDESISSCLNVEKFSAFDVMGKWNAFSRGQKQLVRLWYNLHPDDSYICFCLSKSKNIMDVESNILHRIFDVNKTHPAWISESQTLIHLMKIEKDDDYFAAVAKLPTLEEQLSYLSSDNARDKAFIVNIAGNLIREQKNIPDLFTHFESIYPELCAYLNETSYNEDLKRYMYLYKGYKLSNTLPKDDQIYFGNIQIDDYDSRYSAIHNALNEQSIVLWIDALGIEWLPLLCWSLNRINCGKIVDITITQANLPTETKFNKQWEQMSVPFDKTLNRLDILAHNGVIDDANYYSCVEQQIEFVSEKISKKVMSLLKDYRRIIITGDHGTSRLAARIFHKRDGIKANNVTPMSHGRYGLTKIDTYQMQLPETQIPAKDDAGNSYIVFRNYDHFKFSGRAAGADDDNATYGEIHGGATPEEALVPVVIFDSTETLPLSANWGENPVKIFMRKARCRICFNQPVNDLQAKAGAIDALVSATSNKKEWMMEFKDIKSGMHHVSIVADGKIVGVEDLVIKSALSNDDGDLP